MVPSFNDRSSSVTKSNTAAQIKFPKHEPCKWSFQHDSHSDVGDSAGFINFVIERVSRTRLHSSRMRTARLLPVSTSMHYGGCLGVPASGLGGASLWSGAGCLYPSMKWGRPAPVNRMTDRCKNITLPQTSFAGSKDN